MRITLLARAGASGITAGGLLVLVAGPAAAAGGADNVVIVSAAQSQPPAVRAALQVAFDPGPSADNQNVATARSTDCSGCRAFAAAVQFVIVEGSPGNVSPANAATAANSGCDGCRSFAFAHQVLIDTDGMVQLPPGTRSQLQSIQDQMDQDMVAAEDSTDPSWYTSLDSELADLAAQAQDVIEQDLTSVGHEATAGAPAEQAAHD